MFHKKTYIERRKVLKEKVGKGLILLFGNEYTVEDFVWMGPQPTIARPTENCGVVNVQSANKLAMMLDAVQPEITAHYLSVAIRTLPKNYSDRNRYDLLLVGL